MKRFWCGLLGCVAVALEMSAGLAAPITITTFSASSLPEDIVPVPTGFGTLGGSYLVNNATVNRSAPGSIYSVPASGGAPTVFANTGSLQPIGGVFLPSSYGALAGQFLAAGDTFGASGHSDVVAFNSTGAQTQIAQGVGSSYFVGVAIAPAGFDSAGGQVLLANEGGTIYALNTNRSLSILPGGSLPPGAQGGFLAFAAAGFGAVGGDLLIGDLASGNIYAVTPTGSRSLFATVPLASGQTGLRQMAFAPSGSMYGGDLFVSVSGSIAGGGIAGSVDVLDPAGGVVAYLAEGTVAAPYDPRGIYFPDSTDVWIADADPGIISASMTDFTPGSPVPEPASTFLVGSSLAALVLARRRKRVTS